MAKIIKYRFVSCEVSPHANENLDVERIILGKSIECPTQTVYDANILIAEAEAIPGTIEVTGEFDPEPDTASTDDVLNALLGVNV